MNKKIRQYIGLLSAIFAYYIIHEGAHYFYSLSIGTFKQINFIGLGVQIDVVADKMTSTQMSIFCLVGAVATTLTSILCVLVIDKIIKNNSKVFKAIMYYITLALLFIDPIYLSIGYKFVGGGDMNGIQLMIPENIASILFGILLIINIFIFIKIVLPKYKLGFKGENDE